MYYLQNIQDLVDDICSNQKKLYEVIDNLYQQDNPFLNNREDDSENFANDVTQIKTIIAYSILTSNPNLLEEWVIIPLYERRLNLVRLNYIEDYIDEFTNYDYDYVQNIHNEFHQLLVDRLVENLELYLK